MNNLETVKTGESLIRTVVLILFLISLSLITYDKLPFLNYSSYSPSSVFTFIAAFIFIIVVGYKRESYDKWLVIFIIISTVHSLISGIIYNDIATAIKHIATLIIGFSVFVVVRYAFVHKKDNRLYERVLILSLIFPIFLGFLQMIYQLGFKFNFINKLTSFFVAHVYEGRIQLTSSEPSWAVMHLLSLGIIVLFASRKRTKFMFISMVILFFMSFSALGYGVLLFSFLLFGLITKNKHRVKILLFVCIILFFIFDVIPILIDKFNIQGYYIQRFDYRYLFSPEFLATDGSGFVRIVFPTIGLLQFLDFPLGYGGGFYYIHFKEYLLNHFSYGLIFPEVQYNTLINPENANPRNLFIKVLCEEGIAGAMFFILFLIGVFKQCKTKYSKFVYCLALSLLLNFDSYAFVDFWLLIGILTSGYLDKNSKTEKNNVINQLPQRKVFLASQVESR